MDSKPMAAVTAIVGVDGALLGPCLLVWIGSRVVGFASSHVLAAGGEAIQIAARLRDPVMLPLDRRVMTRYNGLGAFTVRSRLWQVGDVMPLASGGIAPVTGIRDGKARLIAIESTGDGFRRVAIAVSIEQYDFVTRGGAGDDRTAYLAHAHDPVDDRLRHDGAPLLVSHPRSVALGLPEVTLVHAIVYTANARSAYVPSGMNRPFGELVEIDQDGTETQLRDP